MADREDPFVSFHFSVDVQGAGVQGYFTEVSGVGSEHELIEDKVVDGDGREVTRMIPGRLKWEPVVLKKGITSDLSFWDWRKTVADGDLDGARQNCSIFMHDDQGEVVASWEFINAWPSKITGPSVKADANEIGVEEVTIVHEGFERTQ
jgi:phage tail-like protein